MHPVPHSQTHPHSQKMSKVPSTAEGPKCRHASNRAAPKSGDTSEGSEPFSSSPHGPPTDETFSGCRFHPLRKYESIIGDPTRLWIYVDVLWSIESYIYIYHTVNHNNSILLSWSCQHGSHWLAAQHLSHHQENRVDELEIFGENEEANPKASLTSPSTWILQGFGLASGNMAIEIVNFPIKNGDFPVMGQFTRG